MKLLAIISIFRCAYSPAAATTRGRYPWIVEAALRNKPSHFRDRRRGSEGPAADAPQDQSDRLLTRRPDGILVAPFKQGEIGPDLFRAACDIGLEGMVSRRGERPYRAGRSKDWIKVENRKHPAMDTRLIVTASRTR